MSLIHRIAYMRLRTILLITIVVVLIPMYTPLSAILPLPVSDNVMKAYEYWQTIKPGDNIWISALVSAEYWGQHGGALVGEFGMILQRGGRVFFTGNDPTAIMNMDRLVDATPIAKDLQAQGKGYGVNWIFLAFHPQGESEMYALLANLQIGSKDAKFNKPYSEYSIMTNIKTAKDFKALTSYSYDFSFWIRIFVDVYGGGYVPIWTEDFLVQSLIWFNLGRAQGTIMGINDCGAFEKLSSSGFKPASVIATTNNLIGLLFIGALIIANLRFLEERKAAGIMGKVKS